MLADVRLRRVSRRRNHSYDTYFYGFYLPLNFILIYWPIPLVFPYSPRVKEQHLSRWLESYGPELWAIFHIILALTLGFIIYWASLRCYQPRRFLWLPAILAMISLLIYGA